MILKKGREMKILKIGLISLSLVGAMVASDNIVVDRSGVVVANGGESIVISDSADRDALVVNDDNIIISSQRRAPRYASADEYAEAQNTRYEAREPERRVVKKRVVDMSYDSVEVKHSNQNVGTAEVPVIFQLHPLTVHQYK